MDRSRFSVHAGLLAWLFVMAISCPGVSQDELITPLTCHPPNFEEASLNGQSVSISQDSVWLPPLRDTWYRDPEDVFYDVIGKSIFDKPNSRDWRPLSLSTILTEGWNEAWAPSPSGSGGAPRQAWINAASANMNRAMNVSFAQGFNNPPASNAYEASYLVMTPLSRRLMLVTSIPFVLVNNAPTGFPTINPQSPFVADQNQTTFGDVSLTPRVLLHETKDLSMTAEMTIVTPTGTAPLAGNLELVPNVSFWKNISGGWVVRGGTGVTIPMRGGDNVLINQIAIGQTITAHDVPLLGDFTYYFSTVVTTPLSGQPTAVVLTPGFRTHLGNSWYFLAGLPTPLTQERIAELGMIFWVMKGW